MKRAAQSALSREGHQAFDQSAYMLEHMEDLMQS